MRPLLVIAWVALAAVVTPVLPASPPDAGSWSEIGRWPRFTGGVWSWNRETLRTQLPFNPDAPKAPLKAEVREQFKETIAHPPDDNSCKPSGMPYAMVFTSHFEVIYTRNEVLLLYHGGTQYRRIFLDRRTHGDADPSINGDSVGHWEGGTLVVDTAALEPKSNLVPGVPKGEGTHVVERLRLVKGDELDYDLVIDTPRLSAPWHLHRIFKRDLKDQVTPDFCENNREDGGVLDLTPPPPYESK